ncbi:hypothetical protein M5K25_027886 [Dendrobium thyrsiflorum]|uniref:Uncharacterized protein n=1 Tax=Dendrobium thyrsiflorum TaxID=117978 RepID=A0ABD0TUZ3_DENTH
MDFNGYTGDDLDSSLVFMSSDGYFASQALRSGLIGGATMNKLPLSNPSREAIEREILKERIREEILAREMVERRILEEEVRREIEMERIMEIRRLQMERWSGLAGTSGMVMHGDRQTKTLIPSWLEAGVAASLGRGIAQDGAEFAFRDRSSSHLLPKKTMAVVALPAVRHESEKRSPSNEDAVDFTFGKGSPSHFPQTKALAAVAQSSLQNKVEKYLPSNKVGVHCSA